MYRRSAFYKNTIFVQILFDFNKQLHLKALEVNFVGF